MVSPGDLIHADMHGVVVIPREIASEVAEAARRIEESERELTNLCKSPDFTVEKLKDGVKSCGAWSSNLESHRNGSGSVRTAEEIEFCSCRQEAKRLCPLYSEQVY